MARVMARPLRREGPNLRMGDGRSAGWEGRSRRPRSAPSFTFHASFIEVSPTGRRTIVPEPRSPVNRPAPETPFLAITRRCSLIRAKQVFFLIRSRGRPVDTSNWPVPSGRAGPTRTPRLDRSRPRWWGFVYYRPIIPGTDRPFRGVAFGRFRGPDRTGFFSENTKSRRGGSWDLSEELAKRPCCHPGVAIGFPGRSGGKKTLASAVALVSFVLVPSRRCDQPSQRSPQDL